MDCFWPRAVLCEMNVRRSRPKSTLRAAAAKPFPEKITGVDAVWLMPIYPIGEAGRKSSLAPTIRSATIAP